MTRRIAATLVVALLLTLAIPALAAADCPSGGVKTEGNHNTVVLDAGTSFCVKAGPESSGMLVADGVTPLSGYVTWTVGNNNRPDVSHYVVYQPTTTVPEDTTTSTVPEDTTTTIGGSVPPSTTRPELPTTVPEETTTTVPAPTTTAPSPPLTGQPPCVPGELTVDYEDELRRIESDGCSFHLTIFDPPRVVQTTTGPVEAQATTTVPSDTLPHTGLSTDNLPWLALAALVAGGGLVRLTKGQES